MNIQKNKTPDIAVIDYGMGNLRSVVRAFEAVGSSPRLIDSSEQIGAADALIFPGQGAIVDTMSLLKEKNLVASIKDWIEADRPFFGICLGLQALFEFSEEGNTAGLGVFQGSVKRFALPKSFKIPHMGWNQVKFHGAADPLTQGLNTAGEDFYFVHSYFVAPTSDEHTWGTTDYGGVFTSAIRRGNLVATQFHPEKSQSKGLQLYENFVSML